MALAFAVLLVAHPMIYSQGQAEQQKVFEGQLTKVDATAKTITVKPSNGPDMQFTYDDDTQVLGPVKDVQGLAGNAGTPLKVTYRQEKGSNLALRIEVVERTPQR